ncbi:actin cortical patch component [Rhodotorula toruloides]|uniref:Actin cortical patch component n=1 Tax=Rhodotorula toruloides TaxID=5286 RepID=A0A511KBA8_RHOTO|nr:actin cortical patch component [Rhodotorula toruloides]
MSTRGSLIQSSVTVPAPSTTRGQCTKLYSTPSGSLLAYVRAFGHAHSVNVVRPVGEYYAASGDAAGTVKVWDTTGNYSLKLDSKPLSRINDIACDSESKRLVVVGEGRAAWGASFSLETGSSIGEISGHSKAVNAVTMRPTRPFKAVTGSDDFSVCFLNGVPFKYASTSRRHTRFVQSVAYNSSGSLFVSAGSDGQVFLYDGISAEDRGALKEGTAAHEKGAFAASWDREGAKVATSSADGTCKLWDVESGKVVQKWVFEGDDDVQSQQVGNTFAAEHLVSLSFSGDLNILDVRSPVPSRTLYGHQNPITALCVSSPNFDTFISGDSSGRVLATSSVEGEVRPVKGAGHKGMVVDVVGTREGRFVSTAYDDTVKELSKDEFGSSSVSTGSQPKALASGAPASDSLVLATASVIEIFTSPGKKVLSTLSLPRESSSATPTCAATSPSLTAVGTDDSRVHLFSTLDGKLVRSIELRANPTAVAFPPEESREKVVAIGLQTGKVPLYSVETGEIVNARWADISARVTSLAFSPSGTHLAASSLDESIRVYSLKSPSSILSLKNLHKGGASKVCWAGEGKLVSAGADGTIRILEVKLA